MVTTPVAPMVTRGWYPSSSAVLPLREYLLTADPPILSPPPDGCLAWPGDVHATPTPRGGLAMLGGVLAGVLLAYQLPALRLAFDYSDEVVGALIAGGAGLSSACWTTSGASTPSRSSTGQTTAAGVMVLARRAVAFLLDPLGRRRSGSGRS